MKLSDYVANFIADQGIRHVFSVCGGGSMHLVNSVGSNERLKYVACHHEQGAAIAAEAYSRISGFGCALFTTGPGGTNAITGVDCAWIDSIPVLYISGQVTTGTLMEGTSVRQMGIQETDIVSIVKSITKYAICIKDEKNIREVLEYAVWKAKEGRPGPVWLDIPIDIQAKDINPEELFGFTPPDEQKDPIDLAKCLYLLKTSERPLLLVGNGARGSKVIDLIDRLNIPVVTSWPACDMVADHWLHIGNAGLFGDRASNFAIQKADLILSVGCRMSVGLTGHDTKNFAPKAKIIMVDVDWNEMRKPSLHIDVAINASAKDFTDAMLHQPFAFVHKEWNDLLFGLKKKYPVCLPQYYEDKYVNPYVFTEKLSDFLDKDAVVVLDVGMSYNCVYQGAKMKLGQRWINGTGHSTMGYAIPAAIGASFASGRKVVCLIGDGGFQMNIQELATLRYHELPIQVFVFNNKGYIALEVTQDNHFKHRVGVDYSSGLLFPGLCEIAAAYNLKYGYWIDNKHFNFNQPGLIELDIDPDGKVLPKVFKAPFEDMVPHLPREEFNEIMNA